jgi:hypothetical protein
VSALPARIGRYAIEAEVGRGTMGVVYRARDTVLERTVALKTIGGFALAGDMAAFEKRFLNEARVAAALSHPHIVAVHDFGRDDATGTLFIALEYLEGETLDQVVRRGPLEWTTACRIVAAIARALHAAHARGFVHRDVKPANVMVLPTGEAKLMDFGIAHLPSSDLTHAGEVFGTPSNMSPEQAAGDPLDGRSDLFSLGTVLYHLLTGRRAFTGENLPKVLAAVTHDTPAPPSGKTVPRALDDVMARALAKAPGARYQTGAEMAEDLEDVAAGRAPRHLSPPAAAEGTATLRRDVPPPPRPVAPPAPRRRRVWFAAAAIAAVAALGAAAWTMRGPAKPAPAGAAARPAPAAAEPDEESAVLTVDFEHHMRAGSVTVWVDDERVLERALEGRLTQKLGSVRLYKGRVLEKLAVEPGRRTVRVAVEWDGKSRSAQTAAAFAAGRGRTLDVQVRRVVDELVLDWR